METERKPGRRLLVRIIGMFLAGAVVGGVGGWLVGRFIKRSGVDIAGEWPFIDILTLLLAAVLILAGLMTLFAASSPSRYARMIDKSIEPGDAPDPESLWSARNQGVVAALAGIMLALPVLFVNLGDIAAQRVPVAIGVLAVLAWQTWLNLRVWRRADELTRSVIAQTGAICFWTMQLGLFCWALLARLMLVPEVSSWTLMVVLMWGYLIASFIVSWRRGLVQG
ncbi:hypothetical protein ACPVPU_03820 [Sphingomonas sp. CJ99]